MKHEVALWAGVSAFCANVIALKVVDAASGGMWIQFAGAAVASVFVAFGVYAKQRLDDAKKERNGK